MNVVISSGHGKLIRGASGVLDEVDEARKVVNAVADLLKNAGVGVKVFHDDASTSQNENLNRIVDYHNAQQRDLDVSVHFNAYEDTSNPMGTECLYVTQEDLAEEVAAGISHASGLKNRGPKERDDLFFLNNTDEPSILIEVCFVDSTSDADLYRKHFGEICEAIASAIAGRDIGHSWPEPTPEPPTPGDVAIPVVTIVVDPPGSVKFIVK
jgi:N-acetylmuramoyl-L-alanine amidase